MQEFVVDVTHVATFEALISAFNEGFCRHLGGDWQGNLDAFNDYLYWPDEDQYRLVLLGWAQCRASLSEERTWDGKCLPDVLEEIIRDNRQVEAIYA
jgi:hypothetical protein